MTTQQGQTQAAAMKVEQWDAVKAIVYEALERTPSERTAYLDGACGNDMDMRREVESLLSAADGCGSFIERPALDERGNVAGADSPNHDLAPILAEALGERYSLGKELARGGMSRVFLAEERLLNRHVVIKVLSPELAVGVSAERFAREVRFAARLQQANIVPLLNAGELAGLPYYTMPYVRGDSLRALIATGSFIHEIKALGILKDVAKALAYAHGEGVVHRDIKPENVLLSGGTAVVTDFGIAKAITMARAGTQGAESDGQGADGITTVGLSIGTPAYMAPEQIAGEADVGPGADVYAFGILAYELLAARHPFADKRHGLAVMAAHMTEVPSPLAEYRRDLSPGLAALVMRCLAKEVAARPRTGDELLAELESLESAVAVRRAASASGPTLLAPLWDADTPSIAVLPFANLSADPENEYFSDGITDEVLSALTRMRGLRVAARTSSFAFKGQTANLGSIAARLGVKSLLEGSVRRSGSHVRISVQLVNAENGLTLWSERYDRVLSDIFAVQDEIASSIALALEQTLAAVGSRSGSVIAGPARRARETVNAQAFELYLRGRHLLEQRIEGAEEALRCFEKAIELDPGFSATYAGIAYAFTLFGIYYAMRPQEAFPRAREAADRALAIDPTDALALVMRAHIALWYEWDFARAETLARRALDLVPGMYLAHKCIGFTLAAQGQFTSAIAALQRARELDPLSEYATYDLAWVLILAGRWEQAIRELEPAVTRHPKSSELHRAFGFCLFYAGRLQEARAELERVLELDVGNRWGSTSVVQVLAALGETAEARRLVREIEARAPHEPIPLIGIAIMHHWLGDDDAAFQWLQRSVDARDSWLVMLRFDPSMSRLRGSPRFEDLMQQVRAGTSS